ncbi:MAG: hypothetical protein KDA41_01300, partial [Planctomycetales bacterium]|nr:hypothetical protein [Planctomycetales bacterium]
PENRYPEDKNGNGWPDCAFQARWRGYIYAPCTGDYTFYVMHDDNCWVEIDGSQVFYRYCCGWAQSPQAYPFSEGWHSIEIRFDNDRWRHDYLIVEWESPCGVSRQALELSGLKCP